MTRDKAMAASGAMWDVLDSDHNGVLDKTDREAKRLSDFARIDDDGDGELSQAELSTGSADFGAEQAQRRAAWFKRLDTDRSGGLTREEIAGGADDAGQSQQAQRSDRLFRMADASKDGRVTKAEYDAAVRRFLDVVDSNKDGMISTAEREAGSAMLRRTAAGSGGAA